MYKDWTKVEGWLSREEGEALRMMSFGKRVLEFGSWKGRSTIAMAQVASMVVAVDHFRGDCHTGPENTLDAFEGNLRLFEVEEKVRVFSMTVADFAGRMGSGFDLVFCDGEHTEASTLEALEVAKQTVKPGGIIAWHDADCAEVRAAVDRAGLSPLAGVGRLEWTVYV